MSSDKKEWKKPERYIPGPGMPALPPQLNNATNKTVDEVVSEMKKLPFFMTEKEDADDDDNEQIEALKALAYEGEPEEIAGNFKNQGNDQFKIKRYQDAIIFYTKAINVPDLGVKGEDPALGLKIKRDSLANRAACNFELKNYRRCINDCKEVLSKLDSKHEKCIYRAGRAFLALDRVDEAIEILEYGMQQVPDSKSIPSLLEQVKERKRKVEELARKAREREELKQTKTRNLQMAIQAHNFTMLNSVHTDEDGNNAFPDDVKIHLEDPLVPSSQLIVPLLFLYPLEMQSDIFQQVDVSTTTVADFLRELFNPDNLPPWVQASEEKRREYGSGVANLEVYAQTGAGGLVKVGKKSTVEKIFSLKSPVVPIVDGVPRLYIVPKSRAEEWLKSWNKDHARYLLYGE